MTSDRKMYEIILASHLEAVEDRPDRWDDIVAVWISKAMRDISPQDVLYTMHKVRDEFRNNRDIDMMLLAKADEFQARKKI
jgi:hypothetical protein